jgi:uncharacterized protein YgbK (DUF1537 family)
MSLVFGGIADDLTGGLELASLMVREGVSCRVLTRRAGPDALAGVDSVVFGLKTRVAPAPRAVAAFAAAADLLQRAGTRQIFFKYCATFDSTRRGNIGPCADLLMSRTGAGFTAFCPAFPEVARTVYQGHLFGGDKLISQTPKRFDPLTPMREPDLVKVLQAQTAHRVGLLPHPVLHAGAAAAGRYVESLRAAGLRYAIADAVDEDDLRRLAEATVEWKLMTGGSSVAVYYPPLWRARGWIRPEPEAASLPVPRGLSAVLAGSCADRTFEQLEHFGGRNPVLMLELARAADGHDLAAEALAWAAEKIPAGPVAIATSARPDTVAALQKRIGRRRAAALGESVLARIAAGLHRSGVRRFVIAGGETSGAVVEALGAPVLEVDRFVSPGLSRAVIPGPDPVSLYLKSGKLGPIDMFETALA